jgi:hypothetical protein
MRLMLRVLMVLGVVLSATLVGAAVTPKVARAGLAQGGEGGGSIGVGVGDGGTTPGSPSSGAGGNTGEGAGGAPARSPWSCT